MNEVGESKREVGGLMLRNAVLRELKACLQRDWRGDAGHENPGEAKQG